MISFAIGCLTGIALTLLYSMPTSSSTKCAIASQCLGFKTWQEQTRFNKELDIDEFVKGMKMNSMPNGLSEEQFYTILDEIEQESFKKCAYKNLLIAEACLAEISKKQNIHTLIDNKLYYETIRQGIEKASCSPVKVRCTYTISDSNNIPLIENSMPKEIHLAEVIPGFSKGVEDMSVGEKRKLYVHPDLGYGSTHWIAPPQSLLIIDVELIEIVNPG